MKRLAAEVVAPGAAQRDRDGRWDPDVWKRLAEAGVAGMPIPEELGGSGGSIIDCCLVNEALAEGGHDGGLGLSLGAHWVIGRVPIWLHGSQELQARWLPGLCDGSLIGAWASTEPEAGSDSAAHPHDGRPRRRRLRPERHQDLHHERPDRRRLHGPRQDRQGAVRLRRRHHARRASSSGASSTRWAAGPRRPPRSTCRTAASPPARCCRWRARRCGASPSSASPGSARS